MKVSIVGATGYSGCELIRYLRYHPEVKLTSIHSSSMKNGAFASLYPHAAQLCELPLETIDPEKIMATSDLVFLAAPSGIAKDLALPFAAADFPVIDLSGDFRLKSEGAYEQWYGTSAAPYELVQHFDYGLAEFRRHKQSKWIANPGCYATAAELSLAPLLKDQLIELDSIIIDAKSGFSGAGKNLTQTAHFTEAHDNMTLYKMNQHQHIPEIVQQFNEWAPSLKTIQFSTSLIPVARGIFATTYVKAKQPISDEELVAIYKNCYDNKSFVRIQEAGIYPSLKQVIGSNYCDIGIAYNPATNIITLVTVIDNLGKGAAGQAVQNLNILAGFPENYGLDNLPLYP
ncbi:N-acetyl-gamma-glutamyl-phosphate reductase [Erwinia sp. CPCC 100877]|nr:N-acetyl-gamma-glutamyl-phosphate reductase [Erwinia sp. CPCC 100877]